MPYTYKKFFTLSSFNAVNMLTLIMRSEQSVVSHLSLPCASYTRESTKMTFAVGFHHLVIVQILRKVRLLLYELINQQLEEILSD